MKNKVFAHIIRSAAFVLVFVTLFLTLEAMFFDDSEKVAAWEYVTSEEAEPIDMLIVGNSHTFRSFDDAVISEALDINARVLGCPSANGGIITADLAAFCTYSVPEIVVVELCPYMVNNYEDMRTNKQGIVYTHFESIPSLTQRFRALSTTLEPEDVPGGMFQLLRSSSMWERWDILQENLSGLGDKKPVTSGYGFEGLAGVGDYPDLDIPALEVQYDEYQPEYIEGLFCDENREALEKVLRLAEKYDFEVWLCVSPVAYFEKRYMDQIPEIEALVAGNERVKYFDIFIGDFAALDLNAEDFYDLWHLSRSGAEKLTAQMATLTAERLGLTVDYTDVIRYKGETLEYLENDTVRCTMECYGDALYRFKYIDENGEKIETEFSAVNYIEVPVQILAGGTLTVEMKDAQDTGDDNTVSYRFMKRPSYPGV